MVTAAGGAAVAGVVVGKEVGTHGGRGVEEQPASNDIAAIRAAGRTMREVVRLAADKAAFKRVGMVIVLTGG